MQSYSNLLIFAVAVGHCQPESVLTLQLQQLSLNNCRACRTPWSRNLRSSSVQTVTQRQRDGLLCNRVNRTQEQRCSPRRAASSNKELNFSKLGTQMNRKAPRLAGSHSLSWKHGSCQISTRFRTHCAGLKHGKHAVFLYLCRCSASNCSVYLM
jgi:hypothetical protein